MRPAERVTLPVPGKTFVLSLRLYGSLVLQILAQPFPHFARVLVPVHGDGVLGGRQD